MQDTYVSEKSEVGDWNQIGYDAPTSTVFTYTGGTGTFTANVPAEKALDGVYGDWKIVSSVVGGKSKHEPSMPSGADKLTPNFTRIGTSN